FLLAWIWTKHIDVRKGDTPKMGEIWQRFPKFIIGYVVTFLIILFMALASSAALAAQVKTAMSQANAFRGIFFVLTFFTIGVMRISRLSWVEGFGRLAAFFLLRLLGFVIWVAWATPLIFFAGGKPPLVTD